MKTAFLTEMGFTGKIPANHSNMRTEFAWMHALDATHHNIHSFESVRGYDVVFIIFPKATAKLNAVGVEMQTPGEDKDITIYNKNVVNRVKENGAKVCVVQEGPSWFFNEYDVPTQFNFYNELAEADIIFAHNEHDTHFYKGLFPRTKISVIPSLMIINGDTCPSVAEPQDKAIIGGNFCRWYGGFQSYLVACDFNVPIYVPASHCKRKGEEQVPDLHHLPWVFWTEWMKQLATFKYAVNLMPTVAAGTFSMNCAYYGIPCIGNEKVDTQSHLFPELSVDVEDVHSARHLALKLRTDKEFYTHNSHRARYLLRESYHFDTHKWFNYMDKEIYG
jgi:hypothetical protein